MWSDSNSDLKASMFCFTNPSPHPPCIQQTLCCSGKGLIHCPSLKPITIQVITWGYSLRQTTINFNL